MVRIGFVVLCGTLLLAPVTARAASSEADAFVANMRLTNAFLRESSELAADRSENEAIRALATEELRALSSLEVALERRSAPALTADATLAMGSGEMQTGRSVAIDPATPGAFAEPQGTGALMPAALVAIDHLAASRGGAFDKLYLATERTALSQLASLYDAYSKTGDDAALRQVASQQSKAVAERLANVDRVGTIDHAD